MTVAAIAVVLLVATAEVSARPGTCAAAVSVGPLVTVDPSAFVRAHPGTAVSVCAGGGCRDVAGGTVEWVVFPDARIVPKRVEVTVELTDRGVATERTRTFQVSRATCGQPAVAVDITADGDLR
ncbi:hypothetical protein [Leifsonia sp. NPDC077715]|uniref:hypothetical protein n=1 Tax=Leifsonia sp. NPDC077715 TaxID=3155539 RepID=UPI003433F442